MTPRASKAKGTLAERAVARYLSGYGFPAAERRRAGATNDRGDIAGIPYTVIEVKNAKRMELGAWVDQMLVEVRNDKAIFGAVFHKRRGKTDPGDWYVTMTGRQFVNLLTNAVRREI